jgi:hypothetical protein
VSVDWLLTGAPASDGSDHPVAMRDAALAERLGLKLIPEVEITYSLGGGALAEDYPDSRMVPFRQDWLDRLTRGFKADVFLARGQGDSMMPTILDDDDVLVNRADNVVRQQDRIWALGYGELGMIKRVRRLPSGLFQLNSDNPAVSAIEATEDELFVVGRVIWIGRRVCRGPAGPWRQPRARRRPLPGMPQEADRRAQPGGEGARTHSDPLDRFDNAAEIRSHFSHIV